MDKDKKNPIIFFGDSITQYGIESMGYITLLKKLLKETTPNVSYELIGKGVGGNKISDLWNRADKDVLIHHAEKVFIYIGINDVWHYPPMINTSREENFKNLLTALVNKIIAEGARVVLCTPSVIGEKKSNPYDENLDRYAFIVRRVALASSSACCDLRVVFKDQLQINNNKDAESGIYTEDGVHLNARGNQLVAEMMLPFLKSR